MTEILNFYHIDFLSGECLEIEVNLQRTILSLISRSSHHYYYYNCYSNKAWLWVKWSTTQRSLFMVPLLIFEFSINKVFTYLWSYDISYNGNLILILNRTDYLNAKYLIGTLVQQEKKWELLTLGVIGCCENVSIPLKCKYVYVRIYHKWFVSFFFLKF